MLCVLKSITCVVLVSKRVVFVRNSEIRRVYLQYLVNPTKKDLDTLIIYYSRYIKSYSRYCCVYLDGLDSEDLYQEGICEFIRLLKDAHNSDAPRNYISAYIQDVYVHILCYALESLGYMSFLKSHTRFDISRVSPWNFVIDMSQMLDKGVSLSYYLDDLGDIIDPLDAWEDASLYEADAISLCDILDKRFGKESSPYYKNYLAIKFVFAEDGVTYEQYAKESGYHQSYVRDLVLRGLAEIRKYITAKNIINPKDV